MLIVAAGCNQSIGNLRVGASAADIKRELGTPSRVDKEQDKRARHTEKFEACSKNDLARVVEVWVYERNLRHELLLALDAQGHLVCIGRGGVTLVQ
jgi:hypothetical protein